MRPAPLSEVAGPQGGAVTVGFVTAGAPPGRGAAWPRRRRRHHPPIPPEEEEQERKREEMEQAKKEKEDEEWARAAGQAALLMAASAASSSSRPTRRKKKRKKKKTLPKTFSSRAAHRQWIHTHTSVLLAFGLFPVLPRERGPRFRGRLSCCCSASRRLWSTGRPDLGRLLKMLVYFALCLVERWFCLPREGHALDLEDDFRKKLLFSAQCLVRLTHFPRENGLGTFIADVVSACPQESGNISEISAPFAHASVYDFGNFHGFLREDGPHSSAMPGSTVDTWGGVSFGAFLKKFLCILLEGALGS